MLCYQVADSIIWVLDEYHFDATPSHLYNSPQKNNRNQQKTGVQIWVVATFTIPKKKQNHRKQKKTTQNYKHEVHKWVDGEQTYTNQHEVELKDTKNG